MELILLIVLIVLLFGSYPRWPYSQGWGYNPFGIIAFILVIYLILILLGTVPLFPPAAPPPVAP